MVSEKCIKWCTDQFNVSCNEVAERMRNVTDQEVKEVIKQKNGKIYSFNRLCIELSLKKDDESKAYLLGFDSKSEREEMLAKCTELATKFDKDASTI